MRKLFSTTVVLALFSTAALAAGNNTTIPSQQLPTAAAGTNSSTAVAVQGVTGGVPQAANITQIAGAAISLAQKTSALSIPVVLPSDQTVPISGPVGTTSAPGTAGTVANTVQGNASGIPVPVTLPAAGVSAPGTPGTSAITVQGNASGVAIPVSGAAGSLTAAGTPGTVLQSIQGNAAGVPVPEASQATTTGGAVATTIVGAATTNATLVSTGAHRLYGLQCASTNTTLPRWVKVFDKATAPTPGTDTPIAVFDVPQNTFSPMNFSIPGIGIGVTTGLGYAVTTNPALNDATVLSAAGDVFCTLEYK